MTAPTATGRQPQTSKTPAAPTSAPGKSDAPVMSGGRQALQKKLRGADYETGASLLAPEEEPVQLHGEGPHKHNEREEGDGKTKVDHITAAQADTHIQTVMGKIVVGLPTGKVAEGKVRIVDDKAYRVAYDRYFGDDGEYDVTNAFVERNSPEGGDLVWIHEMRGNPGTSVHEALHLYSNASFRGDLGTGANEGATEVFTRFVLAGIGSKLVRQNYDAEHNAVAALVGKTTMETLAKAYFSGDIAALRAAVGAAKFDAWLVKMKAKAYGAATDALK